MVLVDLILPRTSVRELVTPSRARRAGRTEVAIDATQRIQRIQRVYQRRAGDCAA